MELDLRSRRVVQALGLGEPTPTVAVAQGLGISPSTMTGLADAPGADKKDALFAETAAKVPARRVGQRTTFPRQH
jgi:hypothetical protein